MEGFDIRPEKKVQLKWFLLCEAILNNGDFLKKYKLHGEKWRSWEYGRLLRIKNDYYKREESI